MRLTEREVDKLLVFTAADVARRRKARGVKLNHPEAIALISAGATLPVTEMTPQQPAASVSREVPSSPERICSDG